MADDQSISALITRLGKVRAGRVKPAWAPVMGGEVERVRKELEKRVRAAGQLTAAWYEIAPEDLRDHARPTGVSRGTLRLEVDGPAFRYRLERWLKSGGQKSLLERCSASVRRGRVEVVAGVNGEQ